MPQVPVYDNPTIGIAAAPTLQATPLGPEAFGAGLMPGLNEVSKALVMMADHTDYAQVMGGRNDLVNRLDDLAHSTEIDPDTGKPMGYLNRLKQDAQGIGNEFDADLQENLDDIRSGLENDRQRAGFDQIVQKHIQAFRTAINEHEYNQKMAYNGELAKASVDLSLDGIAQDYQFPDLVSSHIDDGITALKSHAAFNGNSADSPVLLDMLTQYESSAHKTVIDSLIKTGQATTAMKYFEEFDKGEAATDDQGNAIPGTEGSVFTKQDREQILSYLKPLSDAQEVATAADTYYQQSGNIVEALGHDKDAFPDDPAMQKEFRQAVLGRASQYQAAVGETVKNANNTIYQAMIANPGSTLDQLAQDPNVTDAVKTMTTYDAHSLSTIKDALNVQATKAQGNTLIQTIDEKLNNLVAAGKHPGASITKWPEFQALNELDAERAKPLLEHEVSQQNADIQHRKSLVLMDQQQQILGQQQRQARQFAQILSNPAALQTVNPIGLRAIGAIDAEQASMLTELQKRSATQAKGQPVSWSADSINRTVKSLLGYKGNLSADQEQIVENGAASFGMYLFQREQQSGGVPLNAIQVGQAAQDWVKQPAMITTILSNTATEVPLGEALKKPDRFLGTSDAYRQVYDVAKRNRIPLTVGQAQKAAAGVVAGGLR